jgi:hypothetical protein
MPSRIPALLLSALAFALCACDGGIEAGEWTGDAGIKAGPGQSEVIAYTLSKVHLKVDRLGDFNLMWEGLTYEGSAQHDELRATRMLGREIPRPVMFRLESRGNALTLIGPDGRMATLRPTTARQ